MGNAILVECVAQRALDVILVDHLVKRLRAILTRDDLIHAEAESIMRVKLMGSG